jgi:1-deoxy-D-xylulose-5-phosphate reductoisomerase
VSTPAKRVCVLGSTGSIGVQALDVIAKSRGRLVLHSLAAMGSVDRMLEQVVEFGPARVALEDPVAGKHLEAAVIQRLGGDAPEVLHGRDGVLELAGDAAAEVVLNAVVGSAGLLPSLAALDAGSTLALANKESLVMAGPLVMERAQKTGRLVPVDSEHSSLFRCLEGGDASSVRSLILTASGGAFRDLPIAELDGVTPEQALRHPVWDMGRRVTVDSASMMNKALEIIEAQHLFAVDPGRIDVLVHPDALVHGMVAFADGTLLAHLGPPDMRIPIAYALSYPDGTYPEDEALDLAGRGPLDFKRPDLKRYPCLALGYRAAEAGGTMPAVLNAADEAAVDGFTGGAISFTAIAEVVSRVMDEHEAAPLKSVEAALEADSWARKRAADLIGA